MFAPPRITPVGLLSMTYGCLGGPERAANRGPDKAAAADSAPFMTGGAAGNNAPAGVGGNLNLAGADSGTTMAAKTDSGADLTTADVGATAGSSGSNLIVAGSGGNGGQLDSGVT